MKTRHTSVVPAYQHMSTTMATSANPNTVIRFKTYQLQYRLPDGSYKQLLDDEGCPIEFLSIAGADSIAKDLSNCDPYPRHGWKIVGSDGMYKFI